MTTQILTQYQALNQRLKQIPRSDMHRFCIENGFRSSWEGLLPRSQNVSDRKRSESH